MPRLAKLRGDAQHLVVIALRLYGHGFGLRPAPACS